MQRKGNPCDYECEYKLVQPLEKKRMVVSQKLKIKLTYNSVIPLTGIYQKENQITMLKRFVHPHVHCIIISINQDVETTYMFIDREMNKENEI